MFKIDDLRGKVCVFTGASGVLGSAMVEALCAQGARVALLARSKDKLAGLAQEMAGKGYEAMPVAASVLDKDALLAARAEIEAAWGPCDVLINCAGGNSPDGVSKCEQMELDTPLEQSFFGMKLEGFDFVFDLNFKGTLLPTMVFAEKMVGRTGCSIINISSMSAQLPLTKVAAYSAAKAAIDNFTRWLATHFAHVGIRVNAIAPGFFATEQNRFLLFKEDGKTLSARGEKIIKATPMSTFGDPDDLGGALVFLASREMSRFVTGTVLAVDGGFSCYAGV